MIRRQVWWVGKLDLEWNRENPSYWIHLCNPSFYVGHLLSHLWFFIWDNGVQGRECGLGRANLDPLCSSLCKQVEEAFKLDSATPPWTSLLILSLTSETVRLSVATICLKDYVSLTTAWWLPCSLQLIRTWISSSTGKNKTKNNV